MKTTAYPSLLETSTVGPALVAKDNRASAPAVEGLDSGEERGLSMRNRTMLPVRRGGGRVPIRSPVLPVSIALVAALTCAAFRESILTGQPAPSSGEFSLRTMAALDAGARSLLQQGQWNTVPGAMGE